MNHWIDSPDALAGRLHAWQGRTCVGLDTEFVRERTYYPQLALVQLSIPGEALLVDPLAPGMAGVLGPLLTDPAVSKLMHSPSEDLQALRRGCGVLPTPLFDTQLAAALCGLGAGLSYQKLVGQITGQTLAKGETRSDWLRRPLSDAQLHYAAEDVLHLHALHDWLAPRLAESGRDAWLAADLARALAQAGDDGEDPWPHLQLRNAAGLDRDGQARLCLLLRWRERQARQADRPKGWILDNELAVMLARRPPRSQAEFHALLDRHPKAPRRGRGDLWALLERGPDPAEFANMPVLDNEPVDKQALKALQAAVATVAEREGLPDGLLCARRHLEALLNGGGWPPALEGWRRGLLEPMLKPLLPAG